MKIALHLFYVCLAAGPLLAQTPVAAPVAANPAARQTAVGSNSMTSILPDLDKLQAAASQTAIAIEHLRIEKWKADGESKRQAQSNADSVQRNLTSALPGMIEGTRSAPQNLSADFNLYRNLNALYDVLVSLTESAGAFGPKADYEGLAQQLQVIESVRRDLGDALERLTSSMQNELEQLRAQIRTQQQATATPPPRKVEVVDDTEPPKKTAHTKKKKPAASGSDSSSGASGSKSGDGSVTPPKS